MDQRDWGLLRETVVRRTQAAGASREDAEDATHDALLAAIREPEHPRSQVAWVSTVAQRRRVDLIRQRIRQERMSDAVPGGPDPTAAGPEDQVVDRAHAVWLAESLTQLPPTTREVVDAVGAGMSPAEVARSMNLSTRSVESHLTRARRHLRRMGALSIPLAALAALGDWALRARASTRALTTAVAVSVPVAVAAVTLLPSSSPIGVPGAAPAPPAATATASAPLVPTPRDGLATPAPAVAGAGSSPARAGTSAGRSAPGSAGPGTGAAAGSRPDSGTQPETTRPVDVEPGKATGADGSDGTAIPPPSSRSAAPPRCPLPLPVVGDLGCALVNLVGGPPAPAPAGR